MSAATGDLSITSREHRDQTILTATGEIDLATSPQLRQALNQLIDAGRHRLVLDLTTVTFCDSVGLGVMVAALKRLNTDYSDGHLRIVCGPGGVRKIFDITGLSQVFPLHLDLSDACSDNTLNAHHAPPVAVATRTDRTIRQ